MMANAAQFYAENVQLGWRDLLKLAADCIMSQGQASRFGLGFTLDGVETE